MRLTILAAASASILISGCSGLTQKIGGTIENGETRANRLIKEVGNVDPTAKRPSPVVHEEGIWIAKKAITLQQQDELPPIFYEQAMFDRTVHSLAEFAERITLRSGIPTKVTHDAALAATNQLRSRSAASVPAAGGRAQAAPAPQSEAPQSGATSSQASPIRITYPSGTLKGLLDTATARFGVFWKYVNGTVQLYYTDTRTFQISAIPGSSALTATVASGSTFGDESGGGGGGGGGGSAPSGGVSSDNQQNTEVNSELSVYENIENAVKIMLSSSGQVVSSPATGTITVTDTPDKLDRIAHFIENENKALTRQVMINVTVLAVTVTDSDNLGIDWTLVYRDLPSVFSGASATPTVNNGTSIGIVSASGRWSGSSLIIDALAKQGRVRRETTASVVTLNNQPVPVQVAKQTTYLRSSQTTLTSDVGSTTTLTPGMVTSGFNMTILPHVLNNGTVLLQFSTDISALRDLRPVESGNSRIESPELDTRNFLQRVAMKSNETLIISGFEQTDDNLGKQGVGRPDNFLFGGGYNATTNKEVIVILITPVAMDGA